MEADFSRSLKLVLVDEGGLSDDPHDHGGRTAHGIIQREYDAWRRNNNRPIQDVWKITPEELTAIYHDEYWMPVCGKLPGGLDYVFFDDRVNSGPAQATRTLQKALKVPVDGHMGPITLKAINGADTQELIKAYCNSRRAFYRSLHQFPRYGRGWLSRVNHVERGANEIYAHGSTERSPLSGALRSLARAKANGGDPMRPPVQAHNAGLIAGITGIAAALAGKVHADPQLLQFALYGLIAVAAVSVVFVGVGIFHDKLLERTIP